MMRAEANEPRKTESGIRSERCSSIYEVTIRCCQLARPPRTGAYTDEYRR